jgi:hypothetical protein
MSTAEKPCASEEGRRTPWRARPHTVDAHAVGGRTAQRRSFAELQILHLADHFLKPLEFFQQLAHFVDLPP